MRLVRRSIKLHSQARHHSAIQVSMLVEKTLFFGGKIVEKMLHSRDEFVQIHLNECVPDLLGSEIARIDRSECELERI